MNCVNVNRKTEPLVSICLPVLNAGHYLHERLETIFAQTYRNWELIAIDNYSDDGTWESLQARSVAEPRMRVSQAPREGMYANWNNTLALARGEYIYVATADDTMAPRCLEVLVDLAERQLRPCIAQCGLSMIDAAGVELPSDRQWPTNAEWYPEFGSHFQQPHYRSAPTDGAMVLLYGTVITSITQAIFPKQAFDRLGGFPNQFGSAGDMAWEGLAGFFYDVAYTPERLATWRIHESQATNNPGKLEDRYPVKRKAIVDWILSELRLRSPDVYLQSMATNLGGFCDYWAAVTKADYGHPPRGAVGRILRSAYLLRQSPAFYVDVLMAKRESKQADPTLIARSKCMKRFLGDTPWTNPIPSSPAASSPTAPEAWVR